MAPRGFLVSAFFAPAGPPAQVVSGEVGPGRRSAGLGALSRGIVDQVLDLGIPWGTRCSGYGSHAFYQSCQTTNGRNFDYGS